MIIRNFPRQFHPAKPFLQPRDGGEAVTEMHSAADVHPVYPFLLLYVFHNTYHLKYIIPLFACLSLLPD